MEATLFLVRIWRVRSGNGTPAFRACVNRVASEQRAFFTRADHLVRYLTADPAEPLSTEGVVAPRPP